MDGESEVWMGTMDSMDMSGRAVTSPDLSVGFALAVLLFSTVTLVHLLFILWQKRDQLRKKNENSISIGIHLTMAISMTVGLCDGSVIGGLAHTSPSLAYVLGLFVGTILGVVTGIPFQHIGVLDGMVSGLMAGLMGVMIGIMVELPGLYLIIVCLLLFFILTWAIVIHFIQTKSSEHKL